MPLKILVAQINCIVGDVSSNAEKIFSVVEKAKSDGVDLVVTPELSLCGYPPEDLLLRPDFLKECDLKLTYLAQRIFGVTVVVGHPYQTNEGLYNAASIIQDGQIVARYCKQELPNYRVFDEARYFDAGTQPCVVNISGVSVGLNICEDVWGEDGREASTESKVIEHPANAVAQAKAHGAELLVVLNASPFHTGKDALRRKVVQTQSRLHTMPIVFCNLIGGQDELVFDGGSFACDDKGDVVAQMPFFCENVSLMAYERGDIISECNEQLLSNDQAIYEALVLGVRDYVNKNGFPGVLIGLSGGIDSALTLAIAVDALGAGRVKVVMMPSQFTADMSREDASSMAAGLGVDYSEIAIKPMFDVFMAGLSDEFKGREFDTTEENLQSRIRGTLLMSLSNKFGSLVLTTGNKSEMSTGYATLYGDMAGGLAVLKDLTKQTVYRLSTYRNTISACIPVRIIERPPSAELRPDQVDSDSLPSYEILDAIVEHYVEYDRGVDDIIGLGYSAEDVTRIVRLIHINEHKRRQSPPGVRVTARGFGKDWRYPITSKFRGLIDQ
ncbi:MAG TPA: NAD+ synthase [Betaproteobacteria bacterium]|jgi:NAD+ synthase (glutamine-hydrolysing)|nr:NAD+ synthase [Betaproteobacteria bacterium]